MSTHNTDITTAFGTTSGTFASQTVLTMDFSLLKAELQLMGTDLDDLMGRIRFFDTISDASTATIDTTVGAVIVCGYATLGDMPPALFDKQGSTPAHNGYFTSNGGTLTWVYIPGTEGISPAPFGFLPSATAAANTTAWTSFVGYVNLSGQRKVKVPQGTYQINTGAGFSKSNLDIDLSGVTFVVNAVDDGGGGEIVIIDLNTEATANEASASIRADIIIHGGKIQAAADLAGTPNKVTGVRVRGLVHAKVTGMRFEDLNSGVDLNPRDGCMVEFCQFYQNNYHIRVEDWQTVNANPQNNWIKHNNFSEFYQAAVDVRGIANGLVIRDNEFVGAPGVQAKNGTDSPSGNGTGLIIDANDFEQGADVALTGTWTVTNTSTTVTAPGADGAATTELAAGDFIRTAAGTVYRIASITDDDNFELAAAATATESSISITRPPAYIDIRDEGKTLYQLVVTNNRFGTFDGNVAPMVVHARDVNGFEFTDNIVATNATAGFWIHLDSACRRVHIARPNFLGLAWQSWPAIGYDCARTDITVDPAIVHFDNDAGLLTGWNPMQLSTGNDGTIDLDSVMGSNYPGMLPPVGVLFTAEAKDSGSATTSCSFTLYPDTSINDNDQWQHFVLRIPAGVPNDEPVNGMGYVPVNDAAGTVAYDRVASGASTLDVRLKASALNMGGGRP